MNLYAFLEDPQIPIDNNLSERAVKPFAISRKNRMFSNSPKGADAGSAAYSIINIAQANGFDVREYLNNILRTARDSCRCNLNKKTPENVARLRESILRGLILLPGRGVIWGL